MADIQKDEIKLMSSQVLADTEDGGGQMTANEIVDGNVNNLFPDISRLDRTYGRVSLRKAYLSVQTADRATYYGAHVALTEQAADPLVSTTLFTTENWFDVRTNCKNRIEGYLVKGPFYPGALWADHYQGTRQLRVLTGEDWETPEIGDVLVLKTSKNLDGGSITEREQFLRVTSFTSEIVEFLDSQGAFNKQVITINTGQALEYDFPGSTAIRNTDYTGSNTQIYTTIAADTSHYYGVTSLKEEGTTGDLVIRANNIMTPIVPSSKSQTAMTDFNMGLEQKTIVGGTESVARLSVTLNPMIEMGQPVKPGTWEFAGSINLHDNGKGTLLTDSDESYGAIQYTTGSVTITGSGGQVGTVTYVPAVEFTTPTNTGCIAVSEQNRGFVYVYQLNQKPSDKTLQIDYLSAGKWYTLRDVGGGELKGTDSSIGSGNLNPDTHSISMTLGAMPDVGSSVLLSWAIGYISFSEINNGDDLTVDFYVKGELSSVYGIVPESVTITWVDGVITYTVTDTEFAFAPTFGMLTGDVEGTNGWINYNTGEFWFKPAMTPSDGETISVAYDVKSVTIENLDYRDSIPPLTFDLGNSHAIEPHTVKIAIRFGGSDYSKDVIVYDDGNGNLIRNNSDETIYGTIEYTTNSTIIILAEEYSFSEEIPIYEISNESVRTGPGADEFYFPSVCTGYTTQTTTYDVAGMILLTYGHSPVPETASQDITFAREYELNKVPELEDVGIVPGSVVCVYEGDKLIDKAYGTLYKPIDLETYDAVLNIDYAAKKITLVDGDNDPEYIPLTIKSLMKEAPEGGASSWVFRCPGSPITPGSFTFSVDMLNGATITGTSAFDGLIVGSYYMGQINYDTGVVHLVFGEWEDKTLKPGIWYNIPENEDGEGNVLRPININPATVNINCVVESYLPLDPDLLGLDPVRLPMDGKVPIFRDGYILLIHHSETEVVTPSAGATVSLSRGNVNLIELYDNNGVYVPEVGNYSVDLVAGEITFEDPLDLGEYTSPFQALHRIEDMVLTSDVQITGHMSISQPLSHDYPADETLISSVLPIGDVQARVYNLFTDSSWDDEWSNERQHGPTTAQYNTVNYPITVTNESSVKERFALIFTGSNTVDIVGEHLGVIDSDVGITTDIAPTNPATGLPYFTIRHEGWGEGWNIGEVLRFNTDAGNYPVWFCRTTMQGPATENSDHYCIQIRGDSS